MDKKDLIPFTTFDASILAGSIAESSQETYKRHFQQYLRYAGSAEEALQPTTLAKWINHLAKNTPQSPHTINTKASAVRATMNKAANQGYITQELASAFSHVDGVKIGALKTRLRPTTKTIITPEDMTLLTSMPGTKDLIDLRDTALLHLAASSGLRASEIAGLKVSQVFKTSRGCHLMVMGKNEIEYQECYLSQIAYDAIVTWLEARKGFVSSEYVFTSFTRPGIATSTNKAISTVGIWKLVKKYAKRAGLGGISTHSLRRFFGTQLVSREDIYTGKEGLRHKNIKTTADHYVLRSLELGKTDNLYEVK